MALLVLTRAVARARGSRWSCGGSEEFQCRAILRPVFLDNMAVGQPSMRSFVCEGRFYLAQYTTTSERKDSYPIAILMAVEG